MDTNEVKHKAQQVNDVAMEYHLSNAVFACNRIVQNEFKAYINEKKKTLYERLLAAEKADDMQQISQITREIWQLKSPFGIHIEYITKGKGRVVFIPDSNRFVITLPRDLLAESRNADGTYNPAGVKKLRWLTAHEMGHIALQTKDLLQNESTQGTIDVTNSGQEADANVFARELLALQHKRYQELFQSGMWEAF